MSDVGLATMSTALWLVAMVALFILLAGWSAGASWGLSASLVRGVRGWADRNGIAVPRRSTSAELLLPILDPYAFVRRDGRDARDDGARAGPPSDGTPISFTAVAPRFEGGPIPGAEVIELGERPLSR